MTTPAVTPLGRVVATERKPNTPHEFHFWTSLDSPVGVGTIVRVEGKYTINGQITRVYGVVVEGFSYSDLQSPLHDVLGHDGSPSSESLASTERAEIRLYTAAVLRQLPDEPLQPVPLGDVYLADDSDIALALRMDSYLAEGARTGIPIGVYHAGGTDAPIYLDADFLIGPEAAHLNITGVSGLATKTSAIEWILSSLFTHFPAQKGSIAALCFNVKGPDLCFLDEAGEIDERDRALYEKCGIPAAPFENVQYFAPYKSDGISLNTLRSRDFHDEPFLGSKRYRVKSFADLEQWFRDLLSAMEQRGNESWRTHHVATIRKVRNRLSNISTRCAGLVTDDGNVGDLPFGSFQDRTVYVIDVASLEEDAQDLVFARVVTKLREHLEKRDLGVKHVVVFVDELNKYAPGDGQDTYVRKMLLDLAERGRYLGLVLFSAQQFRSQVHRRVVGNSGTALYGRMDADELATPGYSVLSPAVKTKLATLEKGQLMVRHPHFTQPIFVRFPRPAIMRGRDGAERYPQAQDVTLATAVLRSLRPLDPTITLNWIQDIIEIHDDEKVIRARNATLLERPADVKRFFKAQFAPIVPSKPVNRPMATPIRSAPSDDPYGF